MLEPVAAPEGVAVPARVSSPAEGSVLTERLAPVRGGQRVLPAYHGAEPCQMALLGESPVAKACSDGGKKGAILMMQTFVRRARENGIAFECVDCHPVEDDFSKLAPEADLEFRKLLFLARPE